jgi:hypothetical protein
VLLAAASAVPASSIGKGVDVFMATAPHGVRSDESCWRSRRRRGPRGVPYRRYTSVFFASAQSPGKAVQLAIRFPDGSLFGIQLDSAGLVRIRLHAPLISEAGCRPAQLRSTVFLDFFAVTRLRRQRGVRSRLAPPPLSQGLVARSHMSLEISADTQ